MSTVVPSLLSLCIDAVCKAIDHVEDLSGLPEELGSEIFARTLQAGKLTPKTLKVFASSGHETIVAALQALNLQDPPPLFDDTPHPWLGEHRRLS